MNKEISIQVKMKTSNMYNFLMRHFYTSMSGIIGVVLSLIAFGYLIMNYNQISSGKTVLLIFGSLLFTVINPISLYFRAMQQVKLVPMFKEELIYLLREDEIVVKQHEEELKVAWSEVQKVVETKNNIIIYVTKVRAFILPKEAIEEKYSAVKELINEKTSNKRK